MVFFTGVLLVELSTFLIVGAVFALAFALEEELSLEVVELLAFGVLAGGFSCLGVLGEGLVLEDLFLVLEGTFADPVVVIFEERDLVVLGLVFFTFSVLLASWTVGLDLLGTSEESEAFSTLMGST
ncbi:MAG: hypothetical protein LUC43_07160 [Burkholderiales bacterium]|nr:hypothetical protein [Burkholderiales bacterium]